MSAAPAAAGRKDGREITAAVKRATIEGEIVRIKRLVKIRKGHERESLEEQLSVLRAIAKDYSS